MYDYQDRMRRLRRSSEQMAEYLRRQDRSVVYAVLIAVISFICGVVVTKVFYPNYAVNQDEIGRTTLSEDHIPHGHDHASEQKPARLSDSFTDFTSEDPSISDQFSISDSLQDAYWIKITDNPAHEIISVSIKSFYSEKKKSTTIDGFTKEQVEAFIEEQGFVRMYDGTYQMSKEWISQQKIMNELKGLFDDAYKVDIFIPYGEWEKGKSIIVEATKFHGPNDKKKIDYGLCPITDIEQIETFIKTFIKTKGFESHDSVEMTWIFNCEDDAECKEAIIKRKLELSEEKTAAIRKYLE